MQNVRLLHHLQSEQEWRSLDRENVQNCRKKREGRACAFILNGTWRSLKRDLKEHQYCFENEHDRRCDALR